MAAAAILNFNKSAIFGPSDACMANINVYLQTQFSANRARNGCLCISKMAAENAYSHQYLQFFGGF